VEEAKNRNQVMRGLVCLQLLCAMRILFNLFGIKGLFSPHLLIIAKKIIVLFFRRLAMRTTEAIPQSKVLSIIVVEVQVVDRVVSAGVDDTGAKQEVACNNSLISPDPPRNSELGSTIEIAYHHES
jgi:hypothetical protein